MRSLIKWIEYYLPEGILTNDELACQYPEWSAKRIEEKLGIIKRHIAADDQTAGDLGIEAAKKMFRMGVCQPNEIDYLIFCTQTPDYFLPTTACIMQDMLGIPVNSGAIDFNLGCSGYVYGLGLAKGLIETEQASKILLVTADTYSKLISKQDKSVRTLFGDGATATLISGDKEISCAIGPFIYGTNGKGAENLIVREGGFRKWTDKRRSIDEKLTDGYLSMNGGEIFSFAAEVVPKAVAQLLDEANMKLDEIDKFVFHQANKYMLDFLRKECKIPEHKFVMCIREFGNTVSSSIPIALKSVATSKAIYKGSTVMLVGFGVGYSWGAGIIRWEI
jgi:3-oxoacyl-[acyl-carrier-protein] synthase III